MKQIKGSLIPIYWVGIFIVMAFITFGKGGNSIGGIIFFSSAAGLLYFSKRFKSLATNYKKVIFGIILLGILTHIVFVFAGNNQIGRFIAIVGGDKSGSYCYDDREYPVSISLTSGEGMDVKFAFKKLTELYSIDNDYFTIKYVGNCTYKIIRIAGNNQEEYQMTYNGGDVDKNSSWSIYER